MDYNKISDRREHKHWHLEKSVSISHLISTILIIISVITFASKMDTRVTVLEQIVTVQHTIDDKQDQERIRIADELKENLRNINNKLDRLIERGK